MRQILAVEGTARVPYGNKGVDATAETMARFAQDISQQVRNTEAKDRLMQRISMNRSVLFRYTAALVVVVIAVMVRHALTPILGPSAAAFGFVTVAVMLCAWLAGTGPAAVASVVGLISVIWYVLMPASGLHDYANMIHVATYLFVSGSTLLMSAAYRRSLSRYITELRHREAVGRELLQERDALGEAEEKFRAVAEISSSAIYIHDGIRLLYMNASAEELFGYTHHELLAGNMWQMVHPEYREFLKGRSAERFRGEPVPTRCEFKIITKSGDERWVDVGARLISFEGKPCILANAFDVTEQKRTEEALRIREEHYSAAIEAGKVGTWEWDISQDKVIFSDNWYSLTSTLDRKYELAGTEKQRPYMDFALWRETVHEDDRPKVDAAIESALKQDTKYEVEFRVSQKATDEVRWLAGSGRVLRDSAGNPLRMIGSAVDITERRLAEQALRNSEKLAAAGRLAASIAHEINNPLEAVTNLIFLARTTEPTNPEVDGLLTMAEEELRRAAHLTKQTLGFYRDSTFPSRFNVAHVIDDLLSLYARRIEANGVKVEKHYVDPGEIHGMIGEIRQAISNLVANALDAMSRSGGTLHIRLRRTVHSQSGSALRITVADTGLGIPNELRKKIFEPFFTTKQETGTGLGLWLTKNIVEKHRGTIRVSSSSIGKTGTVFSMTVPEGDLT
jgi:two-component system, sporulation sensor kinase E